MKIDEFEINDEDIISNSNKFLKKYNNIYISDEQINILNNYNININDYKEFNDLIYAIEEFLNDSYGEYEDLEWVSESLSEYNYYNNTNK